MPQGSNLDDGEPGIYYASKCSAVVSATKLKYLSRAYRSLIIGDCQLELAMDGLLCFNKWVVKKNSPKLFSFLMLKKLFS